MWNPLRTPIGAALVVWTAVGALAAGTARAQEQVRASLFAEADSALQTARGARADILAPDAFQEGMKRYQEADEDLKRGRDLEGIRNKLRAATQYFRKATEETKLANVTLATALAARDDAADAEAAQYSSELWGRAEDRFEDAASDLESGDVNSAKRKAADAQKVYRDAELDAIKTHYLKGTWDLLAQADKQDVEKRAPRTLKHAQDLANQAEKLLNENRYDTDEPRALAQEARYEAQHALYLANEVRNVERDRTSMEDVLLSAEDHLHKIAAAMDIAPAFADGLDTTTDQIVARVQTYQDSLQGLQQDLGANREQVADLQGRVKELEDRLGGVAEQRTELVQRMEAQARLRERFTTVEGIFDRGEARVLREGDNVILRLVGLSFPSGLSTIQPQYFGLLTKVQQAINTFPDCTVTVEGHTDSFGGDDQNLQLSKARADAVRQYLLANMRFDPARIESIGYGESEPIATNDTPEGRAKNRRTDVVIHPRLGGQ